MANAFFKLTDHRYGGGGGVFVRLSEIASVSDPSSNNAVTVTMRNGVVHVFGSSNMTDVYRERDKLMYALEQDAKPVQTAATTNLDPLCSATLKAQGLPYPRTCPVHGLGPCPTIRAEEATGD